jgi:hypothetical protein
MHRSISVLQQFSERLEIEWLAPHRIQDSLVEDSVNVCHKAQAAASERYWNELSREYQHRGIAEGSSLNLELG